jgi:hypothetical protein
LANIFLHYVLDVWASWWRRTQMRGDMIIVRYADDFVIGFQYYKERMHKKVDETVTWLASVITGYINYHGVPGNMDSARAFHQECERELYRTLRRRSNKARRLTWKDLREIVKGKIPKPRLAQPFPDERFWRQRLEVGAL